VTDAALLARRLHEVLDRVARATAAAGRPPGSVRLLAASKLHPPEAVRAAHAAGQRLFGESRAQELRDKAEALRDLDLSWHFIGGLQKNKVKYVVGRAALVHSVGELELARAIDERARALGLVQPVLVQVHIGDEASKGGVAPGDALALCAAIHALPGLSLRGLMSLPPWREDPADMRPFHQELRALAEAGRAAGLPLDELSMGMSDDLEPAIAEGATLVRVGTAIFGARAGGAADPVSPAPG
jgi:PLP dependent protein